MALFAPSAFTRAQVPRPSRSRAHDGAADDGASDEFGSALVQPAPAKACLLRPNMASLPLHLHQNLQ